MASIDVECSECGVALQLDEGLLGTSMTCPKCKMPFVVEPAGAYELAEDPKRRVVREVPQQGGEAPSRSRSPSPSPEPPETDEQRRLRERMERWAGGE